LPLRRGEPGAEAGWFPSVELASAEETSGSYNLLLTIKSFFSAFLASAAGLSLVVQRIKN